jgi:protocatechuate 3,4-dioxygenase, alpha subunit
MSDESRPIASPSQTVGPFFHFGLATNEALGRISTGAEAGARIKVRVGVFDGDGAPVPDALVEIYHADGRGIYPSRSQSGEPIGSFTGFGRLPTEANGMCVFETIHPGPVTTAGGPAQAPHINVCLLARGLLRQVYTRIYFTGDAGLDADPILALVPAERRATLLATPRRDSADTWDFAIHLQGDRETVFFDF